jgi:hypothetical protein
MPVADANDPHDHSDRTITGTAMVGGDYYLSVAGVNGAYDATNQYLLVAQAQ